MIDVQHVTKTYGVTKAVDDLSFSVQPGRVTGFLGPNGAGKSTTMRMMLGLDRPNEGSLTIDGKPYRALPAPLRSVGALLEARALHPGRKAKLHLRCLAESNSIPLGRVDEVLRLVGLQEVANRRAGTFSLGMSQRLGIAAALLGDPAVLLFDEPVNGLDPEGILWVRNFMKMLAKEGRTVFVSSHLMSEMALTADHLVVIGRGRLIADTGMAEFIAASSHGSVRVRSPETDRLAQLLIGAGGQVTAAGDGALSVGELDAPAIGELAGANGVVLHELTTVQASLEQAYMELTGGTGDFSGAGLPGQEPTFPGAPAPGISAPGSAGAPGQVPPSPTMPADQPVRR